MNAPLIMYNYVNNLKFLRIC